MKRIVSSFSPLGRISDSMLVTKPYLYSPPRLRTVSMVSALAAMGRLSFSNSGAGNGDIRPGRKSGDEIVGPGQLGEHHAFQRAADGGVDPVDAPARDTEILVVAGTRRMGAGALGQGD